MENGDCFKPTLVPDSPEGHFSVAFILGTLTLLTCLFACVSVSFFIGKFEFASVFYGGISYYHFCRRGVGGWGGGWGGGG